MAQTKVVVVTRYTDYDSEFTFLGVFSSGHKAHQEISTNIDKYGKYSYRKSVGDWDYKLYINNDVVELRGLRRGCSGEIQTHHNDCGRSKSSVRVLSTKASRHAGFF
jgi:hypothetical protein